MNYSALRGRILANLLCVVALASVPACSGGDSDSDSDTADTADTAEDGACTVTSDCNAGLVCVAVGDAGGTCTPKCSASADECGAMATCSGVGALEVNVCKDDPPSMMEPPEPEEEPRIPCMSDAECDALTSGAICVEWKGARDCTIPCTAESDCDLPAAGGIEFDFLTCLEDEADPGRKGCVPDEACFADPQSCTTFPGFP